MYVHPFFEDNVTASKQVMAGETNLTTVLNACVNLKRIRFENCSIFTDDVVMDVESERLENLIEFTSLEERCALTREGLSHLSQHTRNLEVFVFDARNIFQIASNKNKNLKFLKIFNAPSQFFFGYLPQIYL